MGSEFGRDVVRQAANVVGALAAMVILLGRTGSSQGYLAYAATVLWALTGVAANQYDASTLTTTAAVLSAALVALALFGMLHGGQIRQGPGRTVRPGVV